MTICHQKVSDTRNMSTKYENHTLHKSKVTGKVKVGRQRFRKKQKQNRQMDIPKTTCLQKFTESEAVYKVTCNTMYFCTKISLASLYHAACSNDLMLISMKQTMDRSTVHDLPEKP